MIYNDFLTTQYTRSTARRLQRLSLAGRSIPINRRQRRQNDYGTGKRCFIG